MTINFISSFPYRYDFISTGKLIKLNESNHLKHCKVYVDKVPVCVMCLLIEREM